MSQDNYNIDKNVCREIYVILTQLGLYNRLPEQMREYIEKTQNLEYNFSFNPNAPLFYQVENNETKSILTYFFIKYINSNEKDAINFKNKIMEIMKKE